MKKRFEMSDEQLKYLLDACQPVPYIVMGEIPPRTPEENANDAWRHLGEQMGFVWDTAEPCGEGTKVFMAEPLAREALENGGEK